MIQLNDRYLHLNDLPYLQVHTSVEKIFNQISNEVMSHMKIIYTQQ